MTPWTVCSPPKLLGPWDFPGKSTGVGCSFSRTASFDDVIADSCKDYKCVLGGSINKESASNAGDSGSILGSGRSPVEGHGNPLQDSGLETVGLLSMGSQRVGHD